MDNIDYGLIIIFVSYCVGYFISYTKFRSKVDETAGSHIDSWERTFRIKKLKLDEQIASFEIQKECFEIERDNTFSDLEEKIAIANEQQQETQKIRLISLKKVEKLEKRNSRLQHELFCARKRIKTLGSNKK